VKRSDVLSTITTLTRDLGRPPVAAEVQTALRIPMETARAFLGTLLGEGKLEVVGQGYRVSTVDRRQVTIGADLTKAVPTGVQVVSTVPLPPVIAGSIVPADDEDPFSAPTIELMAEQDREAAETLTAEELADIEQDVTRVRLADQVAPATIGPIDQTFSFSAPRVVGRWQVTVIRAVMGAAGIGAGIVSGYFMIVKLAQVMPFPLAALLGSIMICFSVIAFEVVIVFLQRRQRAAASVFVVAWLAIWLFTLMACLSGFYSFYGSILTKQVQVSAPEAMSRRQLDLIHDREVELQTNIAEKRRQIADLQNLVNQMSATVEDRQRYAREYADAQARLLAREQTLTLSQDDLQAARDQESALITAQPVVVADRRGTDFYAWLGEATGLRADALELIASMFPSLLIDLMASGGLAVALFLTPRREDA
jgi:hypothetical protein